MKPPHIDNRDLQHLIAQMKERVPFYTPEWRFTPENPDAGSALFLLFARMFLGNIERLNKVPLKNFMAFLNLFDAQQIAAQPARAHVVFELSAGAKQPVWVPAGVRLSAISDGGENVPFETVQPLLATPARLAEAYNVSRQHGVCELYGTEKTAADGFVMFDVLHTDNLQEHTLYVLHPDVLFLSGTAVIEVEIRHDARPFTEGELLDMLMSGAVQWSYSTASGWCLFTDVRVQGNRLILYKSEEALTSRSVNEEEGLWIRAQYIPGETDWFDRIELTSLGLSSRLLPAGDEEGITPDVTLANDTECNPDGDYIFGELFMSQSMYYVSCADVFSKKGSTVTFRFDLEMKRRTVWDEEEPEIQWKMIMRKQDIHQQTESTDIWISRVVWEYWNGHAWMRLPMDKKYEHIFFQAEDGTYEVTFECPEDMQRVIVNGMETYWVRVRIAAVDNLHAPRPVYMSPMLRHARFSYTYGEQMLSPVRCLTYNNLVFTDETAALQEEGRSVRPFCTVAPAAPACYFSFQVPPVGGPLSLYVSIEPLADMPAVLPICEWEYLSYHNEQKEWRSLQVQDGTEGCLHTGIIRFSGPKDMTRASIFQRDRYWIRCVLRTASVSFQPLVRAMYMNAVEVIQQEAIANEIPEVYRLEGQTIMQLMHRPVLSADVWVDETGSIQTDEIDRFLRYHPDDIDIVKTAEDQILSVRIRWHETNQLYLAEPDSRVYTLDHAQGWLHFGDGRRGKKMPLADRVIVSYRTGGGEIGNVSAGKIATLQKSIAFVDSVYNPEAARGGSKRERLRQTMERIPKQLRHRDRAVTAEDFEWLAREVDPSLLQVKCLANHNSRMERRPGHVALVVFPTDWNHPARDFMYTRNKIEDHLRERTSGFLRAGGTLHIVEPAYLYISLRAELIVRSLDEIVPVEQEALRKITEFLDPLTGNHDGRGWRIGEPVHASVFYPLLTSIRAVYMIEKLAVSVTCVEHGRETEIYLEQILSMRHGIIVGGTHQLHAIYRP